MGSGDERQLRILVVAPQPFFRLRGTPIAVRALAEVLGGMGHELHIVSYDGGDPVDLPNCTVHRAARLPGLRNIPPGFSARKVIADLFVLNRCVQLARKHDFDLVHAVEEAAYIGIALRRLFDLPYVYDMDSSLVRQMVDRFPVLRPADGLLRRFEQLAVRRSCAVLTVCRSLQEKAREYGPGVPVGRAEDPSLLHGISFSNGDGEAGSRKDGAENGSRTDGVGDRSEDGEYETEVLEGDGPLVMYVGNLQDYQGIDLLLDGFRRAREKGTEGRLVIIGGASERIRRFERLSARLGIAGEVDFIGPRPLAHLGAYLRQADVLASPRLAGDNTPMKLYSYLDSGRSVLATRIPAHTQVLDEEIACLVETRPEALGEGLARLLGNRELRDRLGARAHERARKEFSREAYRRKILDFYATVAEQVDAPSRPMPARR